MQQRKAIMRYVRPTRAQWVHQRYTAYWWDGVPWLVPLSRETETRIKLESLKSALERRREDDSHATT